MLLLNSRCRATFTAAPSAEGTPSPEVTGSILPSSLTRVLPFTLVFSTHVYQCRFAVRAPDAFIINRSLFLAAGVPLTCGPEAPPSRFDLRGGFAYPLTGYTAWQPQSNQRLSLPNCVPHIRSHQRWYRNINLLSITYAFRPRLRPD